jgi:hypothetical protein
VRSRSVLAISTTSLLVAAAIPILAAMTGNASAEPLCDLTSPPQAAKVGAAAISPPPWTGGPSTAPTWRDPRPTGSPVSPKPKKPKPCPDGPECPSCDRTPPQPEPTTSTDPATPEPSPGVAGSVVAGH